LKSVHTKIVSDSDVDTTALDEAILKNVEELRDRIGEFEAACTSVHASLVGADTSLEQKTIPPPRNLAAITGATLTKLCGSIADLEQTKSEQQSAIDRLKSSIRTPRVVLSSGLAIVGESGA
jgi:hypothetical protein